MDGLSLPPFEKGLIWSTVRFRAGNFIPQPLHLPFCAVYRCSLSFALNCGRARWDLGSSKNPPNSTIMQCPRGVVSPATGDASTKGAKTRLCIPLTPRKPLVQFSAVLLDPWASPLRRIAKRNTPRQSNPPTGRIDESQYYDVICRCLVGQIYPFGNRSSPARQRWGASISGIQYHMQADRSNWHPGSTPPS